MSLSNGRHYLAIPGPSVMPDRVLRAMHRAAPNIYTGALHDLTHSLIPDLKALARTHGNVAIYMGNGHAAWEASLNNVLAEGDKVLVPVTGRFSVGWAGVAKALGAEVETLDFGMTQAADPDRIEETLRADTDRRIKAVLAVHTDTSTSVRNDIAAIRRAIDAAGHPALLMADCICSMACDRFEMDNWGADVAITASQKGLMTPPGLAFVWFNARADAAREKASRTTPYWDWRPRISPRNYSDYFFGTAPTHHLFGLREALDMIGEEGIENVWSRHATLARAIWAAVEAWGAEGEMRLNLADPAIRSHAVTSIRLGEGDADRLRAWTEAEAGVTLGVGLARVPESAYFRIGHMGHVNAQMVMAVLGTIDAGLKALDIAHGRGALDAAAMVIAGKA
jgi:alanine-glyoxylate transaminase/serine-glyoxylate transaminase/serine-pyruvate transaminase